MAQNENKLRYRLLILIANQRLGQRAEELFLENGVPMQYHVFGKGTASSEFVDMFGLGSIDKTVILTTLTKSSADEMLDKLKNQLYLGTPNTGVAFTLPLSGASSGLLELVQSIAGALDSENTEVGKMEINYTMIMAFVDQGYSEAVMAAAKSVGASGGTVFHSRQVGSEESHKFWGITIQDEREVVMILAQKDTKLAIMQAIGEKCGVNSDAHGFVISLPVDSVVGLNKYAKN